MNSSVPPGILQTLQNLGVATRAIALALRSDIDVDGAAQEQWLIVDPLWLIVCTPEGEAQPVQMLRLSDIRGFRILATIGSGVLQAQLDDVWIDLLRFSNSLKFSFDRHLKHLEALRNGETVSTVLGTEADPQRCPNCDFMLEFAGETCPRCLEHGAALRRVAQMIRPHWRAAGILLSLLLVGLTLDMAWPLLTQFLVDRVLASPRPPFEGLWAPLEQRDSQTLLMFVVGALAFVHCVRALINMATSRLSSWVGNMMTYDVRGQLVRKLEQLGLAYYSKQETGSLVGRVAYDTEAIQGFMSQITSGFVMQFLLVIFSFAMMFALEPKLALWAMIPAPAVIGGAFVYWRFVHPRYQRYWERTSKQAGLLNGILTGIRVVKAFAKEEYELERFQKASLNVRYSKDALDATAAFFYPFMGIVFQVGGWIIWYAGGLGVLNQDISLGTLMAFFGYLSMFYGPLGNLTNLTTWLTQFSTQIHRITEILDAPTVLPEAVQPVPLATAHGHVQFRDVWFSYTRGAPVLRGIDLEIQPGERIGLVGRSGSGKTSLINLIYRFYDIDAGEILIDGVDVRSLSKDDLRRHISIVLQEPFLFHGTLAENIAYGLHSARPSEIIAASRAASAHDFVLNHQLAYETSVGERGQELSGGERQRISIARALLRSAPVLILDEATSAIDSESESLIQAALNDVTRTRTTIIIAHRLSTLQNCDRIYVLDNGQISEAGDHRELMDRDGLYARWVRLQQGRAYVEWDDEQSAPARPPPSRASLDSHVTRWLNPDQVVLSRGANGDLRLSLPGEPVYKGLYALRCFPVSYPDRYISLRFQDEDGRSKEVGIIEDLSSWSLGAQKFVAEALSRRYLFQRIERIYSIKKFSHFLSFHTKTHLGEKEFVLRHSQDAIKRFGERGRLLVDIEDNVYVIPDCNKLRTLDRASFDRYVFW